MGPPIQAQAEAAEQEDAAALGFFFKSAGTLKFNNAAETEVPGSSQTVVVADRFGLAVFSDLQGEGSRHAAAAADHSVGMGTQSVCVPAYRLLAAAITMGAPCCCGEGVQERRLFVADAKASAAHAPPHTCRHLRGGHKRPSYPSQQRGPRKVRGGAKRAGGGQPSPEPRLCTGAVPCHLECDVRAPCRPWRQLLPHTTVHENSFMPGWCPCEQGGAWFIPRGPPGRHSQQAA